MIVWYPLLKLLVSLLAIYIAFRPINRHIQAYKDERTFCYENGEPMPPGMTFFPTDWKAWLPLAIVTVFILVSPFRLQSTGDLERTVQSYDAVVAPPPMIEREARQKYTPANNETLIQDILKKEATQ